MKPACEVASLVFGRGVDDRADGPAGDELMGTSARSLPAIRGSTLPSARSQLTSGSSPQASARSQAHTDTAHSVITKTKQRGNVNKIPSEPPDGRMADERPANKANPSASPRSPRSPRRQLNTEGAPRSPRSKTPRGNVNKIQSSSATQDLTLPDLLVEFGKLEERMQLELKRHTAALIAAIQEQSAAQTTSPGTLRTEAIPPVEAGAPELQIETESDTMCATASSFRGMDLRTIARTPQKLEIRTRGNIMGSTMGSYQVPLLTRALDGWNSWRDKTLAQDSRRLSPLAEFVRSKLFRSFSTSGILLNCVFMCYSVDYEMDHYSAGPNFFIKQCEVFFLAWYSIEWLLSVAGFRLHFFIGSAWKYNLFDTVVLAMQLWTVLSNFNVVGTLVNASFMRVLRSLRLLNIERVAEVIRPIKKLRDIWNAVASSCVSLVWCVTMMALIIWMFSLVFVQRVAEYCAMAQAKGDTIDPDHLAEMKYMYGSVLESMLSLFQATYSGEDWSKFYNVLRPTGAVNQCLFLVFVSFMQIAMVNIVTGVFVESAMAQLAPSRYELAEKHRTEMDQTAKDLCDLFEKADREGSGRISRADFYSANACGKMTNLFEMLGVKDHDVMQFFDLTCSAEDNKVDIGTFVHGCMRLRGSATSFDLKALTAELRDVHADTTRLLKQIRAGVQGK